MQAKLERRLLAKAKVERAETVRKATYAVLRKAKTAVSKSELPDLNQYPVAIIGDMNDINSSSYSESWNSTAITARGLHYPAAVKVLIEDESERFLRFKAEALTCNAALPPRVHEAQAVATQSTSRISISEVTFQDNTKKTALVPLYNSPTQKALVKLDQVRNGGAAACDKLCMARTKVPCVHVHAAAMAAGSNVMDIICPELKTAHWKEQYAGTEFPLPSEAQIERHANLVNRSICLPPALKRPKGRPKSTKRKQGFMEKHGKKKRSITCMVCYLPGHTKATCPDRPNTGGSAGTGGGPTPPWGPQPQPTAAP
jgi:hypothetical protein